MKVTSILKGQSSAPAFSLPVFPFSVPAGEPIPYGEVATEETDLNKRLIRHPETTFGVTVEGESMKDAGIVSGDFLLVDRALEPTSRSIVIVDVDGELTVKHLIRIGRRLWLVPRNKNYQRREIKTHQQCNVWGVVTHVIRQIP